jgi:hypothetical protein
MEKAQKVLDALNAYKNKMIDASQLRRAINPASCVIAVVPEMDFLERRGK